jgi:dipeptidyl aminopeptidase/acylaminoacyl peptidase
VAGTSAGGHLALMLGVTGENKELEGDVGGNLDQSSRVQAIVDYFGPSDFLLRSRNQAKMTEPADSPVHLLLGVAASQDEKLARLASPAFHVTADDAPLLIIHGDKDTTVFLDQSERMVDEYRKLELDVTLEVVPGGGHGGNAHFTDEYRKKVAAFLEAHLGER